MSSVKIASQFRRKKYFFFYTIAFLFLFSISFAQQLTRLYRFNSGNIDSFSSLTKPVLWPTEMKERKNQRLLANESLTVSFRATNSNLGTVAILFEHFQKRNTGHLLVQLTDETTKKMVYDNIYPIDKMTNLYYYTFGFPILRDSKNHDYRLTITSLDGTAVEAVGLGYSDFLILKYDFSLASLRQNPWFVVELLGGKMKNYLLLSKEVPASYYLQVLLLYTLPLFMVRHRKDMWRILSQVNERRQHFMPVIEKTYPWILFTVVMVVSSYFGLFGADAHHDGIVFKPALDVANGKMLFKETFTQYGALTTLLQATSLAIFGKYLVVIRLLTAFFYALIGVMCYKIWSTFSSKALSFWAVLIWLVLSPNYEGHLLPWSSVYALFFQLLTIFFFQQYAQNNNVRSLFISGATTALTFWCKLNIGLYTALGLVFSLILIEVWQRKNLKNVIPSLMILVLGGIAASVPILGWIILRGATVDWVKQTFLYSLHWAKVLGNYTTPYQSLFPASRGTVSIWALFPMAVITILGKTLFSKTRRSLPLLMTCIFSLFSWLQYYPMSDPLHTYWASTPMIGIVVYFFYSQVHIHPGKDTLSKLLNVSFATALLVLLLYKDVSVRYQAAVNKIQGEYVTVENPTVLKYLKLSPALADSYQGITNDIARYQDEHGSTNVVTNQLDALYVTFTPTENFHPMYVNWSTVNDSIYKDYATRFTTYVEQNRPLVIGCCEVIPASYCPMNPTKPAGEMQVFVPCDTVSSL